MFPQLVQKLVFVSTLVPQFGQTLSCGDGLTTWTGSAWTGVSETTGSVWATWASGITGSAVFSILEATFWTFGFSVVADVGLATGADSAWTGVSETAGSAEVTGASGVTLDGVLTTELLLATLLVLISGNIACTAKQIIPNHKT